jgi:hypothetical protein
MKQFTMSPKTFCILSGSSAIVAVLLLVTSFRINPGPPPNSTISELTAFGQQHIDAILWGGWLQAVGPVFIVLFSSALVRLSGTSSRLSGMMTNFGATILMTVSLIEITFYMCTLFRDPAGMGPIGMTLISSAQHLYFYVAAPAFFIPLGFLIINSGILPKLIGFLGIAMGLTFLVLGIISLKDLILPMWVTEFGIIQVLWWLLAAITLIARSGRISYPENREKVGGSQL